MKSGITSEEMEEALPRGSTVRFTNSTDEITHHHHGFPFFRSRTKERDPEETHYDEGFDVPREGDFRRKQIFHGWKLLLLAYQSAGVIYGDIGTSPLYVFSSTFDKPPTYDNLLGALSIIIYTLTLIVTVKYVFIVLNADNEGQGGTFAMYSLLSRFCNISTSDDPNKENLIRFERHKSKELGEGNRDIRNFFERSLVAKVILGGVALFGVSLIMSDGVLTPAQSVLGAIQGLTVVEPDLSEGAIVGITCGILVLLFAMQPLGVERISIVFAPIVIIWLLFNFTFGIYNLVKFDHSVLKAFSPYFAGLYFVRNKTQGWRSLGGILLCFTGVEALFADLGAFSKRAIQISWLSFAYPCLLLAYIGQAAVIADKPEAYSNPFFNSVPPHMFWPAQIVAILAAIVASQALITSTFQLLFQLVNTGYFPSIKIVYTSVHHHSQIYVPFINWLMMLGTIVVTAIFRNTTKLGNAYGVCVILDTVITTTLVSLVAMIVWKIKWYFVLPFWLTSATFEGLYLTSALNKVPEGAWFTVGLAFILASIFWIWRYGKEVQWASERKGRLPRLSQLVKKSNEEKMCLVEDFGGGEITSLKGLGIFFDKTGGDFVPVVYQEFIQKLEAQPIVQVFLHLRATTVPYVPSEHKYSITRTGLLNCYRIVVRYGYAEEGFSKSLGSFVYEELRKYITTGLLPDGRSYAVAVPDATRGSPVYTKVNWGVDSRLHTAAHSEITLHEEAKNEVEEKREDAEKHAEVETEQDFKKQPFPKGRDIADKDHRLRVLDDAYKSQVLYIIGKTDLQITPRKNFIKNFFLGAFLYMRELTNGKVTSLKVPMDKMVEVGLIREM